MKLLTFRRLLYILLIPLLPVLILCLSEKNKYNFQNTEIPAAYHNSNDYDKIIDKLLEINKSTKETEISTKFIAKKNPLENISNAFSQTILDKLGHFADTPIHRACLVNRNVISSEKKLVETKGTIGAIGINAKINKNLKFWAKVTETDCKSVFKKDFFNEEFFPPEYVYPVFTNIGPEDTKKKYNGEEYNLYFREIFIDASNSFVVIKLNWWIVLSVYLLLILAWSFIYFQIRKTLYHLRGLKDTQ